MTRKSARDKAIAPERPPHRCSSVNTVFASPVIADWARSRKAPFGQGLRTFEVSLN
jgi:hypothetical protein